MPKLEKNHFYHYN